MTYSFEQQLRQAWITKYGSPAGYHKATQQQKEEILNETNNNEYVWQHIYYELAY